MNDHTIALWQLSERVRMQSHWDFSYFARVKRYIDEKIAERSDADSFPLLPQRLVAEVRAVLGAKDVVALGVCRTCLGKW
jgi:acetolactate synthase I/II/III large subunit